MALAFTAGSVVAAPGQQIALSGLLSVTAGAGNPAYVLLSGFDRSEYPASVNGHTGTLSGNGSTVGFTAAGGDGSSLGILFSYDAATGRYVNGTYGDLASLVLNASTDQGRSETFSLYGSDDLSLLRQDKGDPLGLLANASSAYLGTLDVVTGTTGAINAQATPNGIASMALSYVGQTWNMNGCWTLACNIAARAGASLPVASTLSDFAGQANGEWMVAYNGPTGAGGDWKSMLRTGDVIVYTTASGNGHVATVASGAGADAQVVDNTAYVNASGTLLNGANDGVALDIIVPAAHALRNQISGVSGSSVVIYRLDTPVVTATAATLQLGGAGGASLSALFSAADPAGKAVVSYQVYDTTAQDRFAVGGTVVSATSAGAAVTVSAAALASSSLLTGGSLTSTTTGTLAVRAYNGTYWGDWTTVGVSVTPSLVQDTAAAFLSNLSSLASALAAGALQSVRLTDAGKPVLALSVGQLARYGSLLDHVASPYLLSVTATSDDATLTGSTNATNQLSAGTRGGNHVLRAGAGTSGVDTLTGGTGADALYGSTSAAGAALLVAGRGANTLYGGLGGDQLYGGGRSLLQAGAAYQELFGGYAATASDTLIGAAGGHDYLAVSGGNNLLKAGTGSGSVLVGGSGADRLEGSASAAGSAVLIGGSGASTLAGGLGADSLVGGGQSLLQAGATGQSQLLLGGYGASAHDTLSAGSNNAVLAVANGSNLLQAGTGRATLIGGAGHDDLVGGGGDAVMAGGTGLSTLQAGTGSDTLVGGGQSLLRGGDGTGGTSLLLGGFSAAAHDTLMGGTGSGETLAVATGSNSLYADPTGNAAFAMLIAGTGSDTLYGSGYGAGHGGTTAYAVGAGNTSVLGGAGNDYVAVGAGNGHIVVDGGAGENVLTFTSQSAADATITTAAGGSTTVTFDNSAQSVTMTHVGAIVFSQDGTVHALAA